MLILIAIFNVFYEKAMLFFIRYRNNSVRESFYQRGES